MKPETTTTFSGEITIAPNVDRIHCYLSSLEIIFSGNYSGMGSVLTPDEAIRQSMERGGPKETALMQSIVRLLKKSYPNYQEKIQDAQRMRLESAARYMY